MPRKRKEQPDNFYKAFPVAMRKLMEQKAITQNELAEHLGKTRQSISYYCDGSSSPDWETVAKIADYFDVSADYLLGRTDDPCRLPSVVDDLGLSLKTVDKIERLQPQTFDTPNNQIQFRNASSHALDVLNCLLESPVFDEVLGNLLMCFDSYWINARGRRFDGDDYEFEEAMRDAGQIVLTGIDAARFYANEAGNALRDLACKEIPTLVDACIEDK